MLETAERNTFLATPKPSHKKAQSSACPVLGHSSVRGIPSFCPSNSEPGACNPRFEAQNGRPRKHPGTTPGRSNSPKTDIRLTGFNMTGFRCPGAFFGRNFQTTDGTGQIFGPPENKDRPKKYPKITEWPRNRTGTGNRNRRNRFPRNRTWNRNRRLTVLQEPKPEPEPSSLLSCTETQRKKKPSLEEPPEPKTGTAQTVPPPNRNRTEPNRGHPEISSPKKSQY